mmetsp:Transcript_48093/g.114301  ORF Transcript_48093/g.114301 Transcript_48093/m.114301 type:complete len:206 (-) Transcript_48093:203-820(-)
MFPAWSAVSSAFAGGLAASLRGAGGAGVGAAGSGTSSSSSSSSSAMANSTVSRRFMRVSIESVNWSLSIVSRSSCTDIAFRSMPAGTAAGGTTLAGGLVFFPFFPFGRRGAASSSSTTVGFSAAALGFFAADFAEFEGFSRDGAGAGSGSGSSPNSSIAVISCSWDLKATPFTPFSRQSARRSGTLMSRSSSSVTAANAVRDIRN